MFLSLSSILEETEESSQISAGTRICSSQPLLAVQSLLRVQMSLTGPPGEAVRVGNWLNTDCAMEPGNRYSHGEKARYPGQKRLALNM